MKLKRVKMLLLALSVAIPTVASNPAISIAYADDGAVIGDTTEATEPGGEDSRNTSTVAESEPSESGTTDPVSVVNQTVSIDSDLVNGSVKVNGTAMAAGTSGNLAIGSTVTVDAEPNIGFVFASASVKNADGTAVSISGSTSSFTFTMPAQGVTIYASFKAADPDNSLNPVKVNGLVVNGQTAGTATVNGQNITNGTSSGNIKAGNNVSIVVDADSDNFELKTISVKDSDGADISGTLSGNVFTFTMPEKSVTANVEFYTKRSVSVTSNGGSVTINGQKTYPKITPGTEVTVKAAEDTNHILSNLTINGADAKISDDKSTATFTMPDSDVSVIAEYVSARKVMVNVTGSGSGTFSYTVNGEKVTNLDKVKAGDKITITATAAEGSFFGKISSNAVESDVKDNAISFTMPEEDVTVEAVFNQAETVNVTANKEVIKSYGEDVGKDGGVSYKTISVNGASYQVIADQNFFKDGKEIVAGTVLDIITTDNTGTAATTATFTGPVHIVNTQVPSDENLDSEEKSVSFTGGIGNIVYNYAADTMAITVNFDDNAQEGQTVTLSAATDININAGDTIKAGEIIATAKVTNGTALFTAIPDSRYGTYSISFTPAAGTFASRQTIVVPESGQEKEGNGYVVSAETVHQKTNISVLDEKGNHLNGAQFEILDEKGTVKASFTSGTEDYVLDRLLPGTYTLHTVRTAPGYVYNTKQDIEFKITDEDQVKDVTIAEKKNTVAVSVTDAEDGAVTKNAVLNIFRIDNESRTLVGTIGTNGDLEAQQTIEGLPAGNYVLSEKTTPMGYQKAEDSAEFTIDEETPEYVITVTSARTYGHVNLTLLSSINRNPLAGGVYELSKDGKVVATMTTNSEGKAVSKDLLIGDYENGEFLGSTTYKLQEATAPDGFIKDEKTYDIKLAYLNDTIPVVAITATIPNTAVEEEIPETRTVTKKVGGGTTTGGTISKTTAANIQTGDPAMLYGYGAAGSFAAGFAALAGILKKKKKNTKNK